MAHNPDGNVRNRRTDADFHQRHRADQDAEPHKERVAFVERLPQALSYAANLDRGDHAILIYDNLVVAAEYFSAYIEEGINRQESTCFVGPSRERYVQLLDQAGVQVATLENNGYLRYFAFQDFCVEGTRPSKEMALRNIEALVRTSKEKECRGMRFILLSGSSQEGDFPSQSVIEFERWLNTLSAYPMSTLCCYEARDTLHGPRPDLFLELLKAHGHCLFQGTAMPTSMLVGIKLNPLYPKMAPP
jgi:hypothetical protein